MRKARRPYGVPVDAVVRPRLLSDHFRKADSTPALYLSPCGLRALYLRLENAGSPSLQDTYPSLGKRLQQLVLSPSSRLPRGFRRFYVLKKSPHYTTSVTRNYRVDMPCPVYGAEF